MINLGLIFEVAYKDDNFGEETLKVKIHLDMLAKLFFVVAFVVLIQLCHNGM